MAAVMTSEMDNTDKIVGLYDECLRMGLKVTPPDINVGKHHFSVNENGEIVYGIGAIKGVVKVRLMHWLPLVMKVGFSEIYLIYVLALIWRKLTVVLLKSDYVGRIW